MAEREPDSQAMMSLLMRDTFPDRPELFLVDSVRDFFDWLFREKKLRRAEVIRKANISRTYGYQILDGTRMGGRDYYLSIAVAMKLDLRTTQRLLAVTKTATLHPLIKRDAAIIFAINHGYDTDALWTLMTEVGLHPLDTGVE